MISTIKVFIRHIIQKLWGTKPTNEVLSVRKPKDSRASIANLKGDVDLIFNRWEHPDFVSKSGYSCNVDITIIRALRKLGPFIMPKKKNDDYLMNIKRYEWVSSKHAPTIAFVSLVNHTKDTSLCEFRFAQKVNKRNYMGHVEKISPSESMYLVGIGCVDDRGKKDSKILWVYYYYALNTITGITRALKYRNVRSHSFKKGGAYYSSTFSHPKIVKDNELAVILNFWAERDSHWLVEAKTVHDKATFCIPQNEAKYYFKDRTITDNGRRKPIFHWVIAHKRRLKDRVTTVKTHTRGNKNFTWGRYSIKIMLPKRDTAMLNEFDIMPVPDSTDTIGKTIPLDEVITRITQ